MTDTPLSVVLLVLCVLLAGCGSAGTPSETPTPTAPPTSTSTPTAPPTTVVTTAPTTAPTEAPAPAVSFPSCNVTEVDAASYDRVVIGTGDGVERFEGDFGGSRTFEVDAPIEEVLVGGTGTSVHATNPNFKSCIATPESTPTPTPTPEPDWEERANVWIVEDFHNTVLVYVNKSSDSGPKLRITFTVEYWTEDDPVVRPFEKRETVIVEHDEPMSIRYWINTSVEGSIVGTSLEVHSVEPV